MSSHGKQNPLRVVFDSLIAVWNLMVMPGRSYRGPLPPPDDQLLERASELRRHVQHLSENIGERNVQRRPDKLCDAIEYIEAEFQRLGYTVDRQEYDVDGVTCANLEIEISGRGKPDEIVIVGAHYDSVVNCPAANDNASGVAAVLNLASAFRGMQLDRTLRLVAFANEEKPYAHTELMGSWVHARRCRERDENVVAMLTPETIGFYSDEQGSQNYPPMLGLIYPSVGDFIAFIGNTRHGRLVRQVTKSFRKHERFPCESGALPEAMSDIGRSDHWPFWQEGYPALMVTDTAPFRYKHYHTPEDTIDKIDFEKMARVVRGLECVIKDLVTV